jgi:hypothetical protein
VCKVTSVEVAKRLPSASLVEEKDDTCMLDMLLVSSVGFREK